MNQDTINEIKESLRDSFKALCMVEPNVDEMRVALAQAHAEAGRMLGALEAMLAARQNGGDA